MVVYNHRKPLYSIHLPKCGGTSFIKVLESWFGDLRFHYFDERANRPPMTHDFSQRGLFFKKRTCVHGHFNRNRGIGVLEYYPEADQMISIMRDPVETAISNFFYVERLEKNGQSFRGGEVHSNQSKDIDEYLEKSQSSIPLFFPVELTLENYVDVINKYFVYIGTMEEYQKTVDILAGLLKRRKVSVPHENKSNRFQTPSSSSIQVFKENNAIAISVYEYVCSLNKLVC